MAITDYQTYTGKLVLETCCECGMAFGMDREFYQRRESDGKWFYCPSGHPQHYTETETQRLQKRLDSSRAEAARLRDLYNGSERRRAALKGVVTRTKNRIAAGMCPECGDHFPNLHRHMHERHPDYATSVEPE